MFGIHHLELKHQVTDAPGLYVTTTHYGDMASNYLKTLLNSDSKSSIISFESLASLLRNKTQQIKNELKSSLHTRQSFFIEKNKSNIKLEKLTNDLNKIRFTQQKSLIIYLPESTILSSKNNERISFFTHLNNIAQKYNLAVYVVIFGEDIHHLNHWLIQHPKCFLGVSTLYQSDQDKYIYQIHYWLSQGEITTNYEYEVVRNNHGEFLVDIDALKAEHPESVGSSDDHFIYISAKAIDSNQSSQQTMVKFQDNQALFDEIDTLHAATLVLSLNQQQEVHPLAMQVYRLRRQFGLKFKVVIREMQQCLRYSDEAFLSRAGINLIVPSSVRYPRFLSMLETLQKQKLTCSIPESMDALLALNTNVHYGHRGYVNNHVFVGRCHYLAQQYEQTQLQFALVKLSLLPGINTNSCLSMCHIKRDGDLITACHDALYVLLSSVRENDVHIALSHIFKLPIRDMFHSHSIFTTVSRIHAQLPEIITHAVTIDEATQQLIQSGSLFANNPTNQADDFVYATHKPLEFSL